MLDVVVATVVVFAFVFDVVPESEQPAARLASATTPSPTINFIRTTISLPQIFRDFSYSNSATDVPVFERDKIRFMGVLQRWRLIKVYAARALRFLTIRYVENRKLKRLDFIGAGDGT